MLDSSSERFQLNHDRSKTGEKNTENNHEGKKNNTTETGQVQQNDADEKTKPQEVKSRHLEDIKTGN